MSSGTTTCNGTYGGSGDQVVVPAGDRCTLASGSHVGTITVKSGGSLIAQGVSVADDLQADGAATLTICGTTIEHDLQVQHAGGQVTIGGSCAGNTIGHDLHVQDNAAGVVVEGNQVGHDMHVQDNSGGSTVSANRVGHDAHCDAGTAGQGNTAGHKNDGCPA